MTEERRFRPDVADWSSTTLLEDVRGHESNWPMTVTDGASMFTLRGTDILYVGVE